jgi:hypothetical protein
MGAQFGAQAAQPVPDDSNQLGESGQLGHVHVGTTFVTASLSERMMLAVSINRRTAGKICGCT